MPPTTPRSSFSLEPWIFSKIKHWHRIKCALVHNSTHGHSDNIRKENSDQGQQVVSGKDLRTKDGPHQVAHTTQNPSPEGPAHLLPTMQLSLLLLKNIFTYLKGRVKREIFHLLLHSPLCPGLGWSKARS